MPCIFRMPEEGKPMKREGRLIQRKTADFLLRKLALRGMTINKKEGKKPFSLKYFSLLGARNAYLLNGIKTPILIS